MTKTYIIQHLPSSGDFDYSENGSAEAAWESEKSEAWVQTEMEWGDKTLKIAARSFSTSSKRCSKRTKTGTLGRLHWA